MRRFCTMRKNHARKQGIAQCAKITQESEDKNVFLHDLCALYRIFSIFLYCVTFAQCAGPSHPCFIVWSLRIRRDLGILAVLRDLCALCRTFAKSSHPWFLAWPSHPCFMAWSLRIVRDLLILALLRDLCLRIVQDLLILPLYRDFCKM